MASKCRDAAWSAANVSIFDNRARHAHRHLPALIRIHRVRKRWRLLVHPPKRRLRGDLLVLTREQCLASFMQAVRDGRRGDYAAAKALVERVRGKAGDECAERAKKEIWNFIRSDKKTT